MNGEVLINGFYSFDGTDVTTNCKSVMGTIGDAYTEETWSTISF